MISKNKLGSVVLLGVLILAGCGGETRNAGSNTASIPSLLAATVATDYKASVQELYISYFGRPADTGGLANFQAQLASMNAPTDIQQLNTAYNTNSALKALIDSFNNSAESAALYSGDNTTFVTAIYNNVLSRAPDAPGLAFWVAALNAGSLTRANASLSIMAGALVNTTLTGVLDAQLVNKKITVASNFTGALNAAPVNGFSGNAAAAQARTMLATVTATTDILAFQSTIMALVNNLALNTTTTTTTSTTSTSQIPVSFTNVTVHDPAVTKIGNTYYSFGSHLAAAKTTDLMNWTKIADGVNAANPLFADVTKALAATFTWSTVVDLWRPYVIALADGKFYMYYDSCQGSSPLSALGVAVADKVEGPYINKQIFLYSGGSVLGYNVNAYPNAIDPYLFHDANGKLWMMYGSYSGGIFILAMDETTGLPVGTTGPAPANLGYGKHLMGGNSSRIEGSSVLYSPQSHYYYMFFTFGGLDAGGGYNIRVARSVNPDGPYLDAKNNDMNGVKGTFAFDDASIAPYAQKLMGNYQFALATGETGTPLGYVSPGGASTLYEAASNQYFMVFHTRFPNTGEFHEIRVHEMFINADGWPVVAPFRYAPLSKSATPLVAAVTSAEAQGSYKMINHGKDITATIKPSQNIQLNADGTVSGAVTGSWQYQGSNNITITLDVGGIYKGVLSRQWNTNANSFAVTFTAQSIEGVSIWGARTGN